MYPPPPPIPEGSRRAHPGPGPHRVPPQPVLGTRTLRLQTCPSVELVGHSRNVAVAYGVAHSGIGRPTHNTMNRSSHTQLQNLEPLGQARVSGQTVPPSHAVEYAGFEAPKLGGGRDKICVA